MQNIINKKKIQKFKIENEDLKKHLGKLRMAHRQNTKNIQITSKVEADKRIHEEMENNIEAFNEEIAYLKVQFSQLRYETMK